MFVKILYWMIIFFGVAACFLMNSTSNVGNNAYQDLISLFVDEKNSRHQLEERLDTLERFSTDVTKELQKDRNNRQQLIDENTRLSAELRNLESNLSNLQSDYKTLKYDNEHLRQDLAYKTSVLQDVLSMIANLTANSTEFADSQAKIRYNLTTMKDEKEILETDIQNLSRIYIDHVRNLTISQETLTEKILNLTNGQEILSKKYHTLLEQYLVVTSQTRKDFVENIQFNNTVNVLNHDLQSINDSIKTLTLRTSQNSQKIAEKGVQLGFSLRNVDQSSNSSRLKFKQTFLNTGNMINMSSGELVCTRAGLYFFTATIVRQPGITESYCFIYVTSTRTQGTVGQASSTTGYASGTTSLVYHLNVGDKVYLGGCGGVDHIYRESSFSGFLIVPD